MRTTTITGMALLAMLAACHVKRPAAPTATDSVEANAAAPVPSPTSPPGPANAPPAIPVATGTPGTASGLPDDRTPLSEPQGPIDPKSAEAAGQVLQRYGALLEEKKFGQAYALWGGRGQASGLTRDAFVASFGKYREVHAEVGKPGLTDGAAGSIYIEVPLRLYGTLTSGARFNSVGSMTLRRVNDVDGSTAEQRRWHIASSELKPHP